MFKASYKKYNLRFKKPAVTSRGVLHSKDSYFVFLKEENNNTEGIGECALIDGLSIDAIPGFEMKLKNVCDNINEFLPLKNDMLCEYPSIRFALETAVTDLQNGGKRILFESDFTKGISGISINGLIWMGDIEFIRAQIKGKIQKGFTCIKMKISASEIENELGIIEEIRKTYSEKEIEIRVDANGAFDNDTVMPVLKRLADLHVHSIEQPIPAKHYDQMSVLCSKTPVPIALDEELIGVQGPDEKEMLIKKIKPQYLILKPSLIGGFQSSMEWISLAKKYDIKYRVTSALESNIGLNAISQWTYSLGLQEAQGLGTGQMFENNIQSPLFVEKGKLYYKNSEQWDLLQIMK